MPKRKIDDIDNIESRLLFACYGGIYDTIDEDLKIYKKAKKDVNYLLDLAIQQDSEHMVELLKEHEKIIINDNLIRHRSECEKKYTELVKNNRGRASRFSV